MIVVFLSDKIITLPNNRNIPYKEKIEIINAQEFATFMGFEGNSLYQYEYFRYLGRKAFYDKEAYNELEELSKVAKNNLNKLAKKYSLCQKDFKNYIFSNGLEYLFK